MSKGKEVATEGITVSPAQLEALLLQLVPAREPTLVVGAPGIGKSWIVKAAAARLGYACHVENLVSRDPTDIGGLPMLVEGKGEHVHFRLGRLIREATEPTLIFFDDLHNGTPTVQASVMQYVLDIAGNVSPHVSFVLAANGLKHRAGGSAIIETMKSRTVILELATTIDDWAAWALRNDVDPTVVAFLRFRPDLLHDFAPTAELTNSPCPRGWERVSRMRELALPKGTQLAAYAGAVGHGAATEFVAFARMAESITPPELVFASPESAPIPEALSTLCAMAIALAHAVTPATMPALDTYLRRMLGRARETVALTVQALIARDASLANCPGYVKMACGPVGDVLVGTQRAK